MRERYEERERCRVYERERDIEVYERKISREKEIRDAKCMRQTYQVV